MDTDRGKEKQRKTRKTRKKTNPFRVFPRLPLLIYSFSCVSCVSWFSPLRSLRTPAFARAGSLRSPQLKNLSVYSACSVVPPHPHPKFLYPPDFSRAGFSRGQAFSHFPLFISPLCELCSPLRTLRLNSRVAIFSLPLPYTKASYPSFSIAKAKSFSPLLTILPWYKICTTSGFTYSNRRW